MMHLHFPTKERHYALTRCRNCGKAIDPIDWVALHNPDLAEIPLYFHTMCGSEFLFKASIGANFMGFKAMIDELTELHHSLTLYILNGGASEITWKT